MAHLVLAAGTARARGVLASAREGAAVGPRRLELFALRTLGNRDLAFGVADRSRSGNRQRGLAGPGGGWKELRESGDLKCRGSGNYSSDEAKEIARLKRELRDAKDALDVLKKAINILGE